MLAYLGWGQAQGSWGWCLHDSGWGGSCHNQLGCGGPEAGICLLMNGVESQDILGLVTANWCITKVGSWAPSAGPREYIAVSWHLWLQGPGFLELALVHWWWNKSPSGLGCGLSHQSMRMVLGLMLVHWWMEPTPRLLLQSVLEPVPAHWCSRLSQELLTVKSVAKMKPYMPGVYDMMFEAVSTSKSLGYCSLWKIIPWDHMVG